MNSDKLYKLSLVIILVIVVIQIINFYNRKPIVIETKYEHMNPALLTHQWENLQALPRSQSNINFYIKGNRYNTKSENNLKPKGIFGSDTGIPCGPKFDWSTKQLPGANNTLGDMLWHQTAPRNILINNCLQCKNWKQNENYNVPVGTASQLTSSFTGTLGDMALDDQAKMNNLNPVKMEELLYDRTVEPLKGSYLPPVMNYKSTCPLN